MSDSQEAVTHPQETVPRTTQNSGIGNLKPWKKGQSGNPGGRPLKQRLVEDEAKANAEAAFKQLVKLVKSKDERVALQASIAVLDRALGKPKQTVTTTVAKRTLDELSTDDLIAALQSAANSDGTPEAETGNAEPDQLYRANVLSLSDRQAS